MENYNLENLKVLVLDDHAPMQRILMSLLRELGINRLTQSDNAVQALRSLQDTDPDLIITDALMEPMDGLEFTRKIREGEAGVDPFVPIIMVSGQAEMRFIIKARDAGITEFLAKPISARSVYMRICGVITSPRPFIRVEDFFGPDRRRHPVIFGGDERRTTTHDYGKEEEEEE